MTVKRKDRIRVYEGNRLHVAFSDKALIAFLNVILILGLAYLKLKVGAGSVSPEFQIPTNGYEDKIEEAISSFRN